MVGSRLVGKRAGLGSAIFFHHHFSVFFLRKACSRTGRQSQSVSQAWHASYLSYACMAQHAPKGNEAKAKRKGVTRRNSTAKERGKKGFDKIPDTLVYVGERGRRTWSRASTHARTHAPAVHVFYPFICLLACFSIASWHGMALYKTLRGMTHTRGFYGQMYFVYT